MLDHPMFHLITVADLANEVNIIMFIGKTTKNSTNDSVTIPTCFPLEKKENTLNESVNLHFKSICAR